MANTLTNHDEIQRLRVEGHTDNDGADDYNLKLSQRRADSVRKHLVGLGISPDRLEAESKPIAPNAAHPRAQPGERERPSVKRGEQTLTSR